MNGINFSLLEKAPRTMIVSSDSLEKLGRGLSADFPNNSVQEAFKLLDPLYHAAPPQNFSARRTVDRVKAHLSTYFKAVQASIENSGAVINFAQDAIALCEFLSKREPDVDLVDFIGRMEAVAQNAHQRAKRTMNKSGTIHGRIDKSTTAISRNLERLHKEKTVAARRQTKKLVDFVAVFMRIIQPIRQQVEPKEHLHVDAMLLLKRTCFLSRNHDSCQDAILLLSGIVDRLTQFILCVDEFTEWWTGVVAWWANIETLLFDVKEGISKFGSSVYSENIEQMQYRWLAIKRSHESYASEIRKLQDYYPVVVNSVNNGLPLN